MGTAQAPKPSTVWPNGIKPKIGDLARSKDVGRLGRAIHIWEACPECGIERWVKRNARGTLCVGCAIRRHSFGKQNPRWNPAGKTVTESGIRVRIDESHPYFCMAHKCACSYAILEHRLVMAEHLGRPLKPTEVVHHIDGNNLNNELSNLLLLPSQAMHSSYTMMQGELRKLEAELLVVKQRVTLLEAENVLLRTQIDTQGIGNPVLSGDAMTSPKRVETIDCPPHEGEEMVHPSGKLEDTGASLGPTPAALTPWRCENRPKTGNAKLLMEHANPVLSSEASAPDKCVETIETAPSTGDEIVHSYEKL